jgi:hypothetical protein
VTGERVMIAGVMSYSMSALGSTTIVGQFEDSSFGLLLLVGAMFLTALAALGLSAVLWLRNRSARRRRRQRRESA